MSIIFGATWFQLDFWMEVAYSSKCARHPNILPLSLFLSDEYHFRYYLVPTRFPEAVYSSKCSWRPFCHHALCLSQRHHAPYHRHSREFIRRHQVQLVVWLTDWLIYLWIRIGIRDLVDWLLICAPVPIHIMRHFDISYACNCTDNN